MYKLKNSYVDRMIDAGISRSEVAFILHVAQHQDDYGAVHSVYYKDVCAAISTWRKRTSAWTLLPD